MTSGTDPVRLPGFRGSSDPFARPIEQKRRHMITVAWGLSVAPIALVQFSKTGIFVHFPFQPDAPGLASRMTLRAGTTTGDLAEEGAVTSHRVKFAHHIDGRCHFSQRRQGSHGDQQRGSAAYVVCAAPVHTRCSRPFVLRDSLRPMGATPSQVRGRLCRVPDTRSWGAGCSSHRRALAPSQRGREDLQCSKSGDDRWRLGARGGGVRARPWIGPQRRCPDHRVPHTRSLRSLTPHSI